MKNTPHDLVPRLFTRSQLDTLVRNGLAAAIDPDFPDLDIRPVVKLYAPDGTAQWLFTEATRRGFLFGLCDVGAGIPKLGYVSIPEIALMRGPRGMLIERDREFIAKKTLGEYRADAERAGYIVP